MMQCNVKPFLASVRGEKTSSYFDSPMQGTWSEDLKDGPGRFVSESGSAQQATFSVDRLLPGQEEGEPPNAEHAPANCFAACLLS